MQELRPRMVARRARPLHSVLLDPVVADPEPVRREVGELVPDRLRVRILRPVAAERARQRDHDLAVAARVAGARNRCAHAVDPPLGVRERAVLLGEARGREDDVRVLARRLVQEEILRDDELELREPLLDVRRVRLRLRRVLADQVERLDPPVVEPGHHLVEPVAGALGQVDAPGLGELLAHLRVVPGLVAGEVVRVRARVVQALDVVLAAERVQPGRLVAEVAGHQDEVRERPDVVDAAGVLGDPERVEDRRVPLGRVLAGGGADRLGGDAGDPLGLLGRVAGDDLAHRLEVLAVAPRCTRRPGAPPRGSRA